MALVTKKDTAPLLLEKKKKTKHNRIHYAKPKHVIVSETAIPGMKLDSFRE